MDADKRDRLKATLDEYEAPQVGDALLFFDGNDDVGSIGCNLDDHPGIPAFRAAVESLLSRDDVEAVYVVIAEADPDDDLWPFADTLAIVGDIPTADLRAAMASLRPDELGEVTDRAQLAPSLEESTRGRRVQIAWWD